MKTLIKKSIFLTLLLILVSFIFKANAQPHLCEDPCPPGPLKWDSITLCTALCPPDTVPGPAVFVWIAYRIRNCNGQYSIIIEDYVVIDDRFNIANIFCPGATINCSLPNPMSANDLKQAAIDAINRLVGKLGNPSQGNYEVYFKGACYSLVQLSFPDGTFFAGVPDDSGKIDTFYLSSNTIVTQAIPCNDVCCKVTYKWQVITLSNGETISKWVPVSFEGDGGNCENQPMPDYNNYPNKLEAQIPGGGTVTGTLISQEPCELTCPRFVAPPPPLSTLTSVKTDLVNNVEKIQLTASPIPFTNFIHISSNKPILKAVVYDMKGKKVLSTSKIENGELNTSELKEGVYFIQVHFADNNVKSLKVIKQ
jgi:hypothetical protein